jgi:hypothetical protein
MAKRNLVMGNTLTNTCKFVANTMMAMLFMVVLTSCSGEAIGDHHPSSASNLIGSITEDSGLGWAEIDVVANATDADNNNLSASANVRYACEKEVFVDSEEELGLPVVLTLTSENTIATGDKNIISRTENHGASKGVTLNVAGPDLSKGGTLGERTEEGNKIRQEVLANLIDEAFATATSLPEGKIKEWRGSKTSVVKYYRVYVKPTPVEVSYRRTFNLDFSSINKGKVFAQMRIEKVQGEQVVEAASHFGVIAQWGAYNPQVTSINVLGTSFRNEDIAGVNSFSAEKDGEKGGLGDDGKYTRRCIRHTNETYSDVFTSTPDAEGNTDRPVRSNLDVWVYEYVCVLSDGHTETFNIDFEIKSVKNEVDTTTNVYERIIEVRINGEVVDTMTGKVQLIIVG